MAETFLSQLFIDDNRVESEVNAQCGVCFQPYGTLNEQGMAEFEVRLPCKHTIGSMCAWTWFKTNNKDKCPQCRKVLFPSDPDQHSEHDNMEDVSLPVASSTPDSTDDETSESSDDDDDDDESDPDSPVAELFDEDAETFSDEMRKGCENLFTNEDVVVDVLYVADVIAEALKAADHKMTDGYSLDAVAATAIYVTSYFLGFPKSCREVASELKVDEYLICSLYTNVYDNKVEVADLIGTYDEDGALEDWTPFSWPPLIPETTDSELEDDIDQAEDDNDEAESDSDEAQDDSD